MKYILVLAFLLMPAMSYAGDGHDHGESAFANGAYLTSFALSEKTIKNLDVKTEKVEKHELQKSIELPCVIKNPPEQSSLISVNYMSRVEKIYVTVGDKVKKGDKLFTVFSYKMVRDFDIVSPIDGVVSAQDVKVGQIIQQDMNMAEISTMKYFYAEAMAYLSDDISHIKIGDVANIKIDGTHEDVDGVVKSFSPIVDAVNKTKSILIYFQSKDDHIFPNMHCKASIYMGAPKKTLAVSKRAVLGEFGHYFVFVAHGDHFEKQEVVPGMENGTRVEIIDGLHEGDEVVINGNYQMQFINGNPVSHDDEEKDIDDHEGHEEHSHEAHDHSHEGHDHD